MASSSPPTVVKGGYWQSWSDLPASQIQSKLFTHLFCAFANLNPQTNQLDVPQACFRFSSKVKESNPSVKTLLSIGGGVIPSSVFNDMAKQPASRRIFIDSAISKAEEHGFDGLDLDWEHQTTKEEMNNLATLLTEWRSEIIRRKSSLLLTAALRFRPISYTGVPFPAQSIAQNLDFVNVMAYDLYAPEWEPLTTRPHAALRDPRSQVSGSGGIREWIDAGVPANKLVLGFPFYGHGWKLVNPNNNGILAPASGSYNGDDGDSNITFSQIRNFINGNNAGFVYNPDYVTYYCYSGTTWISYDHTQSILEKVKYAKNTAGLLGYFAWSIDQDYKWELSALASETWDARVAN